MKKRLLLATLLLPLWAQAQVFWTENFNNSCTANCTGVGYNGGNGPWTQTITGPEGADPNLWYVSCAENGRTNNICGSGCIPASATATLASMHVGSNPNSLGDVGAAYDAGGLCGILTCPQTSRRIESPTINCTGYSTISLSFNYIEAGSPPNDDASLWYFDGAIWSQLVNTPQTPNAGCGGQGRWTSFTVVLPISANNNPNVKIGFLWVNNDDGVGTDPSFAVDEIKLSVPSVSPPVAVITTSATTACTGTPINFTDNSTGPPSTWAWTFPSGTPASSTAQNPGAVVWNTPGTYTVTLTVTNNSGNNTASQIITVNPTPTVTATASATVICAGNNVTLTATGATSYVWNPGNLTGNPQVVTPAATTTYTLTGTSLTCTDTAQVTVIVQPCVLPVAAATASATTVCVNTPINFTDNTTGGPTSWSWTFPSATPSSSTAQNPSNIVWTTPGTFTVTLTAGNNNGSDTATIVINVLPPPTVTASSNFASICTGSSANITGVGALTYTWLPGNLIGNPQTVTPTSTTTYTVVGVDANGCVDTGQVTVVVNPLPVVTAAANPATLCVGDSATLTGSGAIIYQWQPINFTGPAVSVNPATTTTYTVTGTDANGCASSAQVIVTVQPCSLPIAALTVSDNNICEGTCIGFSDASTGGGIVSWNWSFPGGVPSSSTSQNPSTICYATAGSYDVTLIVTNAYGTDTITLTSAVTVTGSSPVNAGPDQTIAIGNFTTLTATGGNGSYTWAPATGLSCTTCASPEASPTVTTTYYVTYTDGNGCTSVDSVVVDVIVAYSIFVPSAFSPNGDGSNDVLFVRGAGIKFLTFVVYDRVGEKVFESTTIRDGWDGSFRGQPMNTGTFVYYVKAEFFNGTAQVLKGDITLVR